MWCDDPSAFFQPKIQAFADAFVVELGVDIVDQKSGYSPRVRLKTAMFASNSAAVRFAVDRLSQICAPRGRQVSTPGRHGAPMSAWPARPLPERAIEAARQ